MPEPPTNSEPLVYQLRVVLRGVSPLIWRRLLVRSDSTIADLHASLQLVLGWSDELSDGKTSVVFRQRVRRCDAARSRPGATGLDL